jgi:methylmalonyl-CoA mutase, N-terminal domain
MGGASEAIAFMQEEIHRAAYEHQLAVEHGDRVIVGVNRFRGAEEPLELAQPDFSALERAQREAARPRSRRPRRRRGAGAPGGVRAAARGSENLMPRIVDAVKAMARSGEISDALRAEWGTYRPA